jgi:hypothetical protein
LLESLYDLSTPAAGGLPALYAGMESRAARRRGEVIASRYGSVVAAA